MDGLSAFVAPETHAEHDLDAQLALRAGNGDRLAFSDLVTRNYDLIFRIAAKWCGHTGEAEDVAQDVCVKLAHIVKSFDARAKFSTWLYRVVLNAVRDRQRQKSRQSRRDKAYAQSLIEADDGGQETDLMAQELWRAVLELPDKQRDAVMLVYAEEMSHADASVVLGVSETTVSWYVHEARKALKGMLK